MEEQTEIMRFMGVFHKFIMEMVKTKNTLMGKNVDPYYANRMCNVLDMTIDHYYEQKKFFNLDEPIVGQNPFENQLFRNFDNVAFKNKEIQCDDKTVVFELPCDTNVGTVVRKKLEEEHVTIDSESEYEFSDIDQQITCNIDKTFDGFACELRQYRHSTYHTVDKSPE